MNLLRAPAAALRVLPEILTYAQYAPVSGSSRALHPGLLATIPGHLLSRCREGRYSASLSQKECRLGGP